ncbi:MAG: hypothetical protein KDK51_08235 [Deltaproteobacteria bacterium]|nr:hypothetical protein [Deltaproteobacteria bacterium]
MVTKFTTTGGFSLLEVLAALLLLAVSIVALSENQTQSIQLIQATQYRDKALLLAQSKMNETDRKVQEKGLSALKDSESGEFDQEQFPTYTWVITKEKIPVPDFVSLLSMSSGEQAEEDQFDTSALEGPLKAVTEIWGKAIRQVTVEVLWKQRNNEKSYRLVTHYVEKDAFGQVQGLVQGLTGGAGGSQNGEEGENGSTPQQNTGENGNTNNN